MNPRRRYCLLSPVVNFSFFFFKVVSSLSMAVFKEKNPSSLSVNSLHCLHQVPCCFCKPLYSPTESQQGRGDCSGDNISNPWSHSHDTRFRTWEMASAPFRVQYVQTEAQIAQETRSGCLWFGEVEGRLLTSFLHLGHSSVHYGLLLWFRW